MLGVKVERSELVMHCRERFVLERPATFAAAARPLPTSVEVGGEHDVVALNASRFAGGRKSIDAIREEIPIDDSGVAVLREAHRAHGERPAHRLILLVGSW